MVLTHFGIEAARYAAEIFRLGRELDDVALGRATPDRQALRVGVVASLPKTLVYRLLLPALEEMGSATLRVHQERTSLLVDELVSGRLHVVLADEIPPAATDAHIHVHALGDTEILLYAEASLARSPAGCFPGSLEGAPFVLPPARVELRRRLDTWLAEQGLTIVVRAEMDDAGMLRIFGGAGRGVFPVRAALRAEVEDVRWSGESCIRQCPRCRSSEARVVCAPRNGIANQDGAPLLTRSSRQELGARPLCARYAWGTQTSFALVPPQP